MPLQVRPPEKLSLSDLDTKSFEIYLSAFEDYFSILTAFESDKSKLTDAFKVSLFLTTAGLETRTLVSGLTHDNSFAGIKKAIHVYLKPIVNVVVERHQFFTMYQSPDESIQEYFVRLRKQVKRCDFNDVSLETLDNQLVRDQFICGTNNVKIRESLLKESNLTLAKTEQIANCAHAAEKNCNVISSSSQDKTLHVRKVGGSNNPPNSRPKYCTTCQREGHFSHDCYRNHKCQKCSKFGHFENYCRSKPRKPYVNHGNHQQSSSNDQRNQRDQNRGSSSHNPSNRQNYDNRNYNYSNTTKNDTLILGANSTSLLFEQSTFLNCPLSLVVDTGSTISLLSNSFVKRHKLFDFLQPCNFESKVANGSFLSFSHFLRGDLQLRDQVITCKFFVADNFEYDGILGMDVLNSVGLSVGPVGLVFNIVPTIIQDYQDVFDKPLEKCLLKGIEPVEMIKLKEYSEPKQCHNRKLAVNEANVVDEKVTELLKAGVIRESVSPWRHQPLVVEKDNGLGWRMCVNYKLVNSCTLTDAYPIPSMQEVFESLGESTVFTKIDFQQFYHQLPLSPSDIPKTAFYACGKLFEYVRCPFGLKNAVAYCYRLLKQVFEGCNGVTMYLDDVVVHGKTGKEHDQNLQAVFKRIRDHGLGVNLKKCTFAQKEVSFLGFIVGEGTRRPDPSRIESLVNFPLPKDAKALQRYIGMCGFFQNFCS